MIVLTAYGTLKPGTQAAMIEASRTNKSFARTERGCERFDFFFSPDEPEKFVFVEEWTALGDLHDHFGHENFANFMSALESCLAAPPEIRIFEATQVQGP
jgi:quinol monooxygenase YgiN